MEASLQGVDGKAAATEAEEAKRVNALAALESMTRWLNERSKRCCCPTRRFRLLRDCRCQQSARWSTLDSSQSRSWAAAKGALT